MRTQKLYQRIAGLIQQHSNCLASNNSEWRDKTETELEYLAKQYLPHGSGVDCGTKIDLQASLKNPERIILTLEFHHMDENGMYSGWTSHVVTITPSLAFGYHMKISGPNRNGIKEYLHDLLSYALDDVEWSFREEYLRQLPAHPEIKIESHWHDQCRQFWFCLGVEYPDFSTAARVAVGHVYPGMGISITKGTTA